MRNQSAGILLYRKRNAIPEVMLLHPGGPFWKNKDIGAWSIPKGEFTSGEEPLLAAKREFLEETGKRIEGHFEELEPVKLKTGKQVFAWAVEGELDVGSIVCNTIQVEWPPRTGKFIEIPECDRGEWFTADQARLKINPGQAGLIDQLLQLLKM
ncbi:MAG: NUDIX domain-containing protein [Ginsengibacter sp.]